MQVSNALVERLFGIIKNPLINESYRMHDEFVEARLHVKANYRMTCIEFYSVLGQQDPLPKATKSNIKHNFKQKSWSSHN